MSADATGATEEVVIIGGGMGGLSAAYFLSDPILNGRYNITVYTMGWRLGGKGASGRNANNHDRIEEHGLHIWFGTYHNAIALMRRCYGELGRAPDTPLASFDDAFKPQRRVVLLEQAKDKWRHWQVEFPDLPELGGERTVLDLLRRLIGWVLDTLRPVPELGQRRVADFVGDAGVGETATIRLLTGGLLEGDHTGRHLLEFIAGQLPLIGHGVVDSKLRQFVSGGLRLLARMLWDVVGDRLPGDDSGRHTWILAYLGITVARGMLDDELFIKGFDAVDDIELRAWLNRHSSFPDSKDGQPDRIAFCSANLQAFYDASFSYVDGNANLPNVAAGIGLRCVLRILFDYSGPIILEMQAGMGDTVFAPIYRVLQRRGVQFKFFHRLTELGVTDDGRTIDRITFSQQVQLPAGAEYCPLVKVGSLDSWPSTPRYEQIVDGDKLRECGANLEHWSSGWNDSGPRFELRKGQFSRVVLAISYDLLHEVAAALEGQSRWKAMVEGLGTTRTQAAQLWFSRQRDELGLEGDPEIFGSFVEPWSSLVDFSHLLARESWPADNAPRYLNYTCGPLATNDPPEDEAVFERLRDFLIRSGGELWPRAGDANGFDWNTLYAPAGSLGEDRLRHQYWRANIDPTERYVIAKSGTASLRLHAGNTGFANLAIAGEWTDSGVNISSIEATVISGMRAARAISGSPALIRGEHDL
jgi:hypothetical protein